MGRAYSAAKEDYEDFSPLHRLQTLNGAGARYLIVHGDQDAIVHHNQSERFVAALRDKDASVEDMLIPGAGHHWFTLATTIRRAERVDEEPNITVAPVLLRSLEHGLYSHRVS